VEAFCGRCNRDGVVVDPWLVVAVMPGRMPWLLRSIAYCQTLGSAIYKPGTAKSSPVAMEVWSVGVEPRAMLLRGCVA
jgi:hypothetical protein